MGDHLYLYFSARRGNPEASGAGDADAAGRAGVAILRRDGFASMDAADTGSLQTRTVQFTGKHLFVNAAAEELQVEALDGDGQVIEPFSRANSRPFRGDRTLQEIHWKGAKDLSKLSGKPVQFRFFLRKGSLFAFWLSAELAGASNGYVAAGGLGFLSNKDTVGNENINRTRAIPGPKP